MCFPRPRLGLACALLFAVAALAEPSASDHAKDAEAQRAYEISDAVLLDYVKTQMLRGLGLKEPPRVRRAAVVQDREYERVYEEYRKRLEEDDLIEDSEDLQSFSGLQRLYTIRSSGKFPFALRIFLSRLNDFPIFSREKVCNFIVN